jgi:ABC-type Fe3+-hydroxamate transport system substrate-binding protein
MKSKFLFCKVALLLVFMSAVNSAYSQNTGTSSQSSTTSQGAETSPIAPPLVGETQTATPQPGMENPAPSEARRSVALGWLILGFALGLLVGALAWRRSTAVAREDIRRDRAA